MGRAYSTTQYSLGLHGRIPSKKNSRIARFIGAKRFTVPSPAYEAWHQEQSMKLAQYRPSLPIEKCEVILTFYAPDKRTTDLSNKAESVMDLLVDNGFLKDDNWFVVTDLKLKFGGVWREKPHVQVEIKPYENNTEA